MTTEKLQIKIMNLTEENDHSQAAVLIGNYAESVNDNFKWHAEMLRNIQTRHNFLGYMPHSLIDVRAEIIGELERTGNQEIKDLLKAL